MEKETNYRLQFVKHTKSGDHVEYVIRLICLEDSNISVEFLDRYSNLKKIHDVLKNEANSINFPKYPPKKFFGSTDEKFLNQRQTALNAYFNTILGSREFSKLPSLKKWILDLIKKYNKQKSPEHGAIVDESKQKPKQEEGNVISTIKGGAGIKTDPVQGPKPGAGGISFLGGNEIQRCKEVVDKVSKDFIDLGATPQYEDENEEDRVGSYHNIIANNNVWNISTSRFFNTIQGDNKNFEYMGFEEPRVSQLENSMYSKIKSVSKHIVMEIPEEYVINDLIVKINVNRR